MAAKMVAAHKKRFRKGNTFSMSLPDVSQDPSALDVQATFQHFAEAPFPPLLSNPAKPTTATYNIDDDSWSEKADPNTGFVFHIDSPTKPTTTAPSPQRSSSHQASSTGESGGCLTHHLTVSVSSSSLSSTQSVVDSHSHTAPASPSSLVNTSLGFSERFTQSLRLNSHPEEKVEDDISSLGSDGFPSLEKPVSLKKKVAKAFRGTSQRFRRRRYETGSLSDLHFSEQHSPQLSSFPETPPTFSETPPPSEPMSLPQSTLYGSRGIPLHHPGDSSGPTIRIDLSQFQLGVGLTPCSLDTLGIVPARSLIKGKFGSLSSLVNPRSYSRGTFRQHYPPSSTSSHSQPVIIRGIIPGSPIAVTQNLYEGDTIRSVNGHTVNLDNVDSVLAGLSNELQLTIKRGPNYVVPSTYRSRTNHTPLPGGLVRLVIGGRSIIRSHVRKLIEHPHLLLYLTLDTNEEDPEGKDILYQFPSLPQPAEEGEERVSSMQRRLVKLRGLFLTLSDVLGSLVGQAPSCSTILLEDQLIHVGYTQFDKELLLLAFPAERVSQYEAQLIVESTTKLLVLLYGSVNRAFTNPSHHSNLDHLFALMFDLLLGQHSADGDDPSPVVSSSSSSSLFPCLPSAPQLKIPADVKVRLSTALSGLDSADHNNRPEILNLRRPFLLLGSCLFYRGAMACSHLPDTQLREVVRFCQAYRLLELTALKSINQIVIWREVYLRQLQSLDEDEDEVYLPHNGRTFLLIVGLEHTLVCMLMQQMELHPCGEVTPPTIDAVYVDRARGLISELKAEELLAECEGRGLHSTPLPALMSADIALASVYTKSASIHSQSSLPPHHPGRTRKFSEPIEPTPQRRRRSSVGSASSRQTDGSDSDEPKGELGDKPSGPVRRRTQSFLPLGTPTKRKMSGSDLQSIDESSKRAVAAANSRTFRPAYMLTSGVDNMLLHYVNLSPGRGGIVCPTYATPPGPIQSELLQCFRQTCLSVRRILRGRVIGEGVSCIESDSESDEDEWEDEEESYSLDRGFARKKEQREKPPFYPVASSVVEHGVLLHCTPSSSDRRKKQSTPTLRYWVVGRLIRDSDTELYVCFQENLSQNLVEMSFRLLFGWPG